MAVIGIAAGALTVAVFAWCCWDFWRIVQRDTVGSKESPVEDDERWSEEAREQAECEAEIHADWEREQEEGE